MARFPRINLPHIPQHIIQRGNNRMPCFYHEQDYAYYLNKLHEYAIKYAVGVHAFVLMTNHVHLLVTPQTATGISQMMQALGRSYVQYINTTYQRTGTLWEGRFKASMIDSEHYFLMASRYIELNPVRAGMVPSPDNYPWSSYQGNVLGKRIKLLTAHGSYLQLGGNDQERQQNYGALFNQSIPESDINQFRTHTNKGWVIGSEKFKHDIEQHLGRRVQSGAHVVDRASPPIYPSQVSVNVTKARISGLFCVY